MDKVDNRLERLINALAEERSTGSRGDSPPPPPASEKKRIRCLSRALSDVEPENKEVEEAEKKQEANVFEQSFLYSVTQSLTEIFG